MKTQVFKIKWFVGNSIWLSCVYFHNDTINPYRLYKHYIAKGKDGYNTEHKKQIAKYGDLTSVLYHVYQLSVK